MSTTTAQMLLTLPDLNAEPGVWDTHLNASLARIDLHDHSASLGVKVKPNGMDINSDLTFAGFSALNLRAAGFAVQAAGAVNRSLWVNTSNDELYWRTSAGADVKLTSGTTLNMSLVGGITGDYAAAGAALYYDDAAEAYRFLEAAPLPNDWSYVKAGGVDLYEHASSISNFIGLRSPAALAASYNLTFPAALPGSTLLQQVSSAGVISWSNTIGEAVAMSSSLTVGTTLGVTGLITATGGLTAGAASTVDLSAALVLRLPARQLNLMAISGSQGAGTITFADNGTATFAATSSLLIPIPLNAGDRITAIVVGYARNSGATMSFALRSYGSTGASVSLVSKDVSTGTGDATTSIGVSPTSGTLPQTLALATGHYIRIAADNTDVAYLVTITWDRP